MARQVHTVDSLKGLCERFFLQRRVNTSDVLRVYQVAELSAAEAVKEKHLRFIVHSFPFLLEMAGEDNLRHVLGDELFLKIKTSEIQAEVQCKQLQKIKGRVLEPEAPLEPDATVMVARAADGSGVYPYARLKAGVLWPDDVNPKAREAHLSDQEFEEVFGLDRVGYSNLPEWKRHHMKREALLF